MGNASNMEQGFVFNGEFSKSYDLETLKSNMARRLEFVRHLNPENEGVFNTWEIARKQMGQRQN